MATNVMATNVMAQKCLKKHCIENFFPNSTEVNKTKCSPRAGNVRTTSILISQKLYERSRATRCSLFSINFLSFEVFDFLALTLLMLNEFLPIKDNKNIIYVNAFMLDLVDRLDKRLSFSVIHNREPVYNCSSRS